MKKKIRLAPFVCGFLGVVLTSCTDRPKSPSEHGADTLALAKVIPDLEAQQVATFRYQEKSQLLNYKRGFFGEVDPKSQTPRSAVPFDSTARSDLESLWKAIQATDTDVFVVADARYDSSGRLAYAEFIGSKGFLSQRYVYHPGHTLPPDLSNERWHTSIDANWYYRRDDWN